MSEENNYNDNNGPQYNQGPGSNQMYQPDYSDGGKQSNGFGIASMVCGIVALITCCLWCTCIPLAVVSIVLGILQIRKGTGKGMAIAGIVCSAVGLILFLVLTVYGNYILSSGFMPSEYYDFLEQYGNL